MIQLLEMDLSFHELDISGNSIGDNYIEALADALKAHTLLHLIGDDGAKALADVLKKSTS